MIMEHKQNTNTGKLPIYQQIAEQISREISAGLLIDGQRLPSERQLAIDYGVAVRIAQIPCPPNRNGFADT